MDERRGLVVRRDRGDGCVDVSVSSTSNDRFSARKTEHLWVSQEDTKQSFDIPRQTLSTKGLKHRSLATVFLDETKLLMFHTISSAATQPEPAPQCLYLLVSSETSETTPAQFNNDINSEFLACSQCVKSSYTAAVR